MNKVGIDKLAEHLKEIKSRGQQTVILIGAGISKTSGIPLAQEIAEEGGKENYIEYMESLSLGKRSSIFREYNKKAKINSAHLFLAFLVENEYISNILTTNFDNLPIRSLSMQNIYPAIYDLSITLKSESRKPDIKDLNIKSNSPAVFYLHGQISTYPKNLTNELDEIKPSIKDLFDQFRNCCWIVVGYSGNDPVFNCLCEINTYHENLYWIQHGSLEKNDLHLSALLDNRNDTFLIDGYDADTFFIDLRRELGLGFPGIVDKPFSTLIKTIRKIRIMKTIQSPTKRLHYTNEEDRALDYTPNEHLIALAVDVFENHKELKISELGMRLKDESLLSLINQTEWLGGYNDFEDIENIHGLKNYVLNHSKNHQLKKRYSYTLNGYGNWLSEKFESTNEVEHLEKAIEVFQTAFECFDHHDYLSNQGNAKVHLAQVVADENLSRKIFNESFKILKDVKQLTDLDDYANICLGRALVLYVKRFYKKGNIAEHVAKIDEGIQLFEDVENSLKREFSHLSKDLSHITYYSFLHYHWSEALIIKSKLSKSDKLEFLEKAKHHCQMVIDKGDMGAKELLEKIKSETSKIL